MLYLRIYNCKIHSMLLLEKRGWELCQMKYLSWLSLICAEALEESAVSGW